MTTPRERLTELLGTLTDDQMATVLAFATALANGRAVMASCDVEETAESGLAVGHQKGCKGWTVC